MRFLWSQDPLRWTTELAMYGEHTAKLSDGFACVQTGSTTLFTVRHQLRTALHKLCPVTFPFGGEGTDIVSLTQVMSGMDVSLSRYHQSALSCTACQYTFRGHLLESLGRFTVIRHPLNSTCSIKSYVMNMTGHIGECPRCSGPMVLDNAFPPLVCFQLPSSSIDTCQSYLRLDPVVTAVGHTYKLVGVIYWGSTESHFTARLVDDIGRVYSYNDMSAGGAVSYTGLINPTSNVAPSWLSVMDRRVASLAFYSRSDDPV